MRSKSLSFQLRWRLALALMLPQAQSSVQGQVNAWTKPGSGSWEEPYWSSGIPTNGQSIQFTNAGWKALAIGLNTAQTYPQSLNVQSITIFAPTNSYNVLLLNYAGYNTPLRARTLTINSNCVLTTLASSVLVTNTGSSDYRLEVGGAVNQGEFSAVATSFLSLGNIGPGVYNLTNGNLQVDAGYIGGAFAGTFNHENGYNTVNLLRIMSLGEYDLRGGSLGGTVEIYSGLLTQTGGLFTGPLVNNGTYQLSGGTFSASGMSVPSGPFGDTGAVLQGGGSNLLSGLTIGTPNTGQGYPGSGYYALSNGVLVTSSTTVYYSGTFSQFGGTHTIYGPLRVHGDFVPPNPGYYSPGAYYLNGGTLSCDSLDAAIAYISQSGGTNRVANELYCGSQPNTSYYLSGGTLMTSNTTVAWNWTGGFNQSGGLHIVTNLLSLSASSPPYLFQGYRFNGGQLMVKDMLVSHAAVFHHSGGLLMQSGLLTLADGTWEASVGSQQFGRLLLGDSGYSSSSLVLPVGGCTLRFVQSSSVTWSNQSILTIENWNGSLQGGGNHQVIFGANAAGLTPPQISRVRFHNPAGLPPLTYPATINQNGELLPAAGLASRLNGHNLVLEWSGTAVLQTGTNVVGPYVDLPGAVSPWTNQFTDPLRFFRLRL